MQYHAIVEGRFIRRDNRFIAWVDIKGQVVKVHVPNTGRCRELLVEGARVFLQPSQNPQRKTAYTLVTVAKGDLLVNIDSQAPNRLFAEAIMTRRILPGLTLMTFHPEKTYHQSRFDFYYEGIYRGCYQQGYIEVKGVTLEKEGLAYFPDAPTERGVRHLKELTQAQLRGYANRLVFVVQMEGMQAFRPHTQMQPAFTEALQHAGQVGVQLVAIESRVQAREVYLTQEIPIAL